MDQNIVAHNLHPSTLHMCNKALLLEDLLVFHFPTDPIWAPLDRYFLIIIII